MPWQCRLASFIGACRAPSSAVGEGERGGRRGCDEVEGRGEALRRAAWWASGGGSRLRLWPPLVRAEPPPPQWEKENEGVMRWRVRARPLALRNS
jgi:hypothetical protein